ncbi:MAG: RNA polymerase sigma factor [Myxococcales bacterium]
MSYLPDNLLRLEDRLADGLLVERARGGDLNAKRQLFQRYVQVASSLAFLLTGTQTDVEDILQDSFIYAFDHLEQLARGPAFRAWLCSIVTGTAIAVLRRRRLLCRFGLMRREPINVESLVSSSAPPDVLAELRAVYALIDRFPPQERVALVLRRFEQLSLEQIAEQTQASLATVKRRLGRAEQLLHTALARGLGGQG